MAIFSNDPNQGIRDAGLERFIPTPVSSITYKGNAGVNARRAGSYTNTPRIVSGRKKPAPTDPSQMTPEQKSSFMAKSGDSTSGKPSQRFAPYDRIRIGPGSTSTSANESGIRPEGGPAFFSPRARFPHEAHQPDGTHRGGRTLAQQVDGILPPVVAKPNIAPSTFAGKSVPGASAIFGAAMASPRQESTNAGYTLPDGYVEKDPEIAARYAREDEEAAARNAALREKYGPDFDLTPEQMREKNKTLADAQNKNQKIRDKIAAENRARLAAHRAKSAIEEADRYDPSNEPSMDPLNPRVYERLSDALAGAPSTFADYIARKTALAAGKVLPFVGGPIMPGRSY